MPIIYALLILVISLPCWAADPTTQPLITGADVSYLGAFKFTSQYDGATSMNYGGAAMAVYDDASYSPTKKTIFVASNKGNYPQKLTQLEIPASLVQSATYSALPTATILQSMSDPLKGGDIEALSGVTGDDTGNLTYITGLLPYSGRIIISSVLDYGTTQSKTHGVINSTNIASSSFAGFYGFTGAAAQPRAIGGPMGLIPSEWRTLLGGVAFTGNGGLSMIGYSSYGMSLTVFDPDAVGVTNPIPGTTLLYYPDETLGTWNSTDPYYNGTMHQFGGVVWPSGTRSVIIVGDEGTGDWCYGTPEECGGEPCDNRIDYRGPRAYPYRYMMLMYDANELVKVKNGTGGYTYKTPVPYIKYNFTIAEDVNSTDCAYAIGATLDPSTNRLYIATYYRDQPRIDVFQIGTPTEASTRRATGGGTKLNNASMK